MAGVHCFSKLTYRIVWKTTPRYMSFSQKKIRIIHEILKYLCSDNANFKAIFSHYIPGRVVIKVALFSRLYGIYFEQSSERVEYNQRLCTTTYALWGLLNWALLTGFWYKLFRVCPSNDPEPSVNILRKYNVALNRASKSIYGLASYTVCLLRTKY